MKRALLIARREYLAYARTVGFWLSLLALPFFAVLGGAVPILMERSEPVREVVLVEAPSEGASLSAGVQAALDLEALRRQAGALRAAARVEAGPEQADALRDLTEREGYEAGLAELRRVAPQAATGFSTPRERIRIVNPVPAGLSDLGSASTAAGSCADPRSLSSAGTGSTMRMRSRGVVKPVAAWGATRLSWARPAS